MAYPTSIDAPTTTHNDATNEIIHAADVNALATAVIAIETELGTLPKGSAADVKTALTDKVPKSTVTTAGDLIYATGSAAVTRLGIGASTQVLGGGASAPAWVTPPGYEIGYDQITGNVTVSSTTESSGTAVISAAAHTFDGSPVVAHFYSEFVTPAAANGSFVVVSLFEGATQIARLAAIQNPSAGSGVAVTVNGYFRFTPTAASHTYSVTGFQSGGNGTISAGAGGTATPPPAFLRFTKV